MIEQQTLSENKDIFGESSKSNTFNNITLGARQNSITVQDLLETRALLDDKICRHFQDNLHQFLLAELGGKVPEDNLTVHSTTKVRTILFSLLLMSLNSFHVTMKITEFRYIKATYESRINWRSTVDYLRCSPEFINSPRHDHVLVNTAQGVMFAQLVFVFTMKISETIYPIALIHPFTREKSKGANLQKDKDHGFLRLRKLKDTKTEFIFARSIIRGVLLVPARDVVNNYLVFHVSDGDITVRVREILQQE